MSRHRATQTTFHFEMINKLRAKPKRKRNERRKHSENHIKYNLFFCSCPHKMLIEFVNMFVRSEKETTALAKFETIHR